ncbi:restriction endonuclease subunit S [Prevotella histicola]|uniref:restriction endonuclease subunit S n=1 Tax=Prevotella histicola TaxID=470565 RepID=UPI0028EE3396|nr:restriction endonuclease subunit S [Prevotella histicola]
METKTYKLDSLCEITSSKRIFYSEYTESGIPFFRSKEIIDLFNKNNIVTELFISENRYNEIKNKFGVPEEDDMLLTSVGSIGIPYLVKSSDKFYFKDGNLTWFRKYNRKLIDPSYLYQWVISSVGKETLTRLSMGAAQPALTISRLKNLSINIPSISVQQKIASTLSAYDRLIENNTRRIRLLEQMAENLYKEWFVRFRFPEHEKVEMINGLPKGWKRTKLIKNIKTSSGGTPSRNKGEYYKNGTIPWIKTGELQDCILINTEECITEDAVNNSSAKLFPKGTLLMAMYGVNVGKLGISEIEATCNQACCVFTPKQIDYKYYLFHYLKSIREYLLSISFGAAQQNLSQELIKSIRVLFPDEKTNISFVKEVEPLFKEISIIQQQNQLLTRQRDLLLPRLMSGKLEVKS